MEIGKRLNKARYSLRRRNSGEEPKVGPTEPIQRETLGWFVNQPFLA